MLLKLGLLQLNPPIGSTANGDKVPVGRHGTKLR